MRRLPRLRPHPSRRPAGRGPGAGRALAAGALPGPGRRPPRGRGRIDVGRAKACILVFAWGGPSQLDTWDPKPEAPEEIRGEFRAIETQRARAPDRRALPDAGASGRRAGDRPVDDARRRGAPLQRPPPPDRPPRPAAPLRRRRPLAGRLAAPGRAWSPGSGRAAGSMPPSVIMPWIVSHPAAPGGKAPGQHGGWLGKAFDPFLVEGDPNAPGFQVDGLGLPEGLGRDRLRRRRDLLSASTSHAARRPRLVRLPRAGLRRPALGRGPRRLPDRRRGPGDPRPLRPPHPRPVPADGPPAGRGRRPAGHGQLARRRPATSGTPTATTSTSSRTG